MGSHRQPQYKHRHPPDRRTVGLPNARPYRAYPISPARGFHLVAGGLPSHHGRVEHKTPPPYTRPYNGRAIRCKALPSLSHQPHQPRQGLPPRSRWLAEPPAAVLKHKTPPPVNPPDRTTVGLSDARLCRAYHTSPISPARGFHLVAGGLPSHRRPCSNTNTAARKPTPPYNGRAIRCKALPSLSQPHQPRQGLPPRSRWLAQPPAAVLEHKTPPPINPPHRTTVGLSDARLYRAYHTSPISPARGFHLVAGGLPSHRRPCSNTKHTAARKPTPPYNRRAIRCKALPSLSPISPARGFHLVAGGFPSHRRTPAKQQENIHKRNLPCPIGNSTITLCGQPKHAKR